MSLLRVIVLEKIRATTGNTLPAGARVEWTYTSATREQAVQRAWRAFKRDHPHEDPRCWREVARQEFAHAA